MAAAALFLGLSAFHAEEDPNDPFVYDRTESVLHLSLDAPGGTSLSPYDSPVAVGVLLERYCWQIWRQPSTGAEEYREPSTLPESGATVTLTRSPEMGTLAESTLTTDSEGRAWTTFSPDGAASNVSVDAASGDSTASLAFTITSTPGWEESWYLSHTEATLVAEITSALSTQNVAPGENRDLSLSVRYETWDVMASNLGNTRIENFTSAPAEGASVIWSMESGDGAVSGYGTTDSGGLAQGSFTMGSGESILRAEIAYATGQATTATLTFAPQPPTGGSGASEWTHIRSETVPTIVNLSADGSTELSSGETRQFSGQVQGEVWDIWTDGTTEDRRYNYTTSLSWMPLFADVGFGVGSIGSPNLTTDGNGWFSTSFTMGTGPAQIALRFDPLAPPAATIDFAMASSSGFDPGTGSGNPDLWSYLYTDGYHLIQDLSIDGPTYNLAPGDVRTISGTLVWVQWQIWGNPSGNSETRDGYASPVAWTTVNAAVSTGDGTLSSTGLTTGSLGEFSTSFTMGSENSTVVLSVDGPQGTSTYVGFTRPAPPEQWLPIRTESSIVVSLAADENTVSREPGQSLPLRATVTATTWEIRESDRTGEQREFDHQTGPAIGATVSFTHLSGPGSLSTWQAETDADGIAEGIFVLGENTATIRASATFQTANSEAEIVVSPDLWIYQSSEEELELALSLHGDPASTTGIGAALQVRRTETWRNLATGTTETRHQSLSPAENGQITFSPAEGADVTFGTNPLFTDVSGNAITEYRSSGSCPIMATASFAGMTVTSTIAAPQGRGLSGTDGGGTDGSATDGGGNDGTGTQNQNETSGGDNNNLPSDPETLSDVTTELVRRTHSVGWVERGSDGPSGEVTKKYYFRATLEQNITDENGDPQTKIEEVEGERQYEGEILLQWYLQGWYLVGQVEYFERDEVELVASGGGSAMGDLLLAGFTSFDTEYSILRCLVTAETFAEFEGNDHVSAGLVNGALASSFNGDPWEEPERLYFTTLNGTEGPGTDRADYVASPHYPEASWSEYWLQAGSFVAHDTVAKRTFLIHATRRNHQFVKTGEWVGTVTFEIVGNGSVSNRTPILSGFAETDAMGWLQPTEDGRLLVKPDVVKGAFHEVSLLPVEILVPKLDENGNETGDLIPADELKVAKLEKSLTVGGVLTIDQDPDRFYIHIRAPQQLGSLSVKLGTQGNPDPKYNDDPTEIELSYDPAKAVWSSPSQMLVSDEVDDNYAGNGVGADDAKNDRTHLVQLDGKVVISAVMIDGANRPIEIGTSVKVKKTVKVRLVNCQQGVFNLTPCWGATDVTKLEKTLKERFAQIGIKIDVSSIPGPHVSLSGWIKSPYIDGTTQIIPVGSSDLFDSDASASSAEATIYLVRQCDMPGDTPKGASIVAKYMTPTQPARYRNRALVSALNSNDYTGPHELLHILLNAKHDDYPIEFGISRMLWHPTKKDNLITDTKRISSHQEKAILPNPLAK